MTKHHVQKQLQEQTVCVAYTSISQLITGGSWGENSSEAGAWSRSAAHWLARHGLLSLLSYSSQDQQPRSIPSSPINYQFRKRPIGLPKPTASYGSIFSQMVSSWRKTTQHRLYVNFRSSARWLVWTMRKIDK